MNATTKTRVPCSGWCQDKNKTAEKNRTHTKGKQSAEHVNRLPIQETQRQCAGFDEKQTSKRHGYALRRYRGIGAGSHRLRRHYSLVVFLRDIATPPANPRSLDHSALPSPRRLGMSSAVEINAAYSCDALNRQPAVSGVARSNIDLDLCTPYIPADIGPLC